MKTCSCDEHHDGSLLRPAKLPKSALMPDGTYIDEDGLEAKKYIIRGLGITVYQVFCRLIPIYDRLSASDRIHLSRKSVPVWPNQTEIYVESGDIECCPTGRMGWVGHYDEKYGKLFA